MKPSLFAQMEAVAVDGRSLIESPRHWNCGLLWYGGKLWLSYRFHLKKDGGRCATAICELDERTYQPKNKGTHLLLSGPTGTEHHEDARLFMFNGQPHISFTEMRGYRPGVDYTCVVKYAQLRLRGSKWEVFRVWHPDYGKNDGGGKEKNWVFFETQDGLHVVYSSAPQHVVLKLDGHKVERTYEEPGPVWHFGAMRGGTPPVLQPDGTFLSLFHSSVATEVKPHYVRYYAGAYTFDAKAPFTPLRISNRPLMVGSEADGHKVDPRYVDGWKPFVVFPCGLIPDGLNWLVSLGVNDWTCAVGKLRADSLRLGAANGTDLPPRFFKTNNGTVPLKFRDASGKPQFLHWLMVRGRVGNTPAGYMRSANPMEAQFISECHNVQEIDFPEFDRAFTARRIAV